MAAKPTTQKPPDGHSADIRAALNMNIPKDWIEKRAKAEEGDCTTIGAMPELQTADEWIEACKTSNPDASEDTVREWHRQYQYTGGGFDLPNAQAQRPEPARTEQNQRSASGSL